MKVFYIEDNPTNLFLVKKLLKKENIDFSYADTGEKGLKKIIKIKPDIVLIDINLPGLSGYEIAKEIRNNTNLKDTLLIAISVSNTEDDKKIAYAVGFNAFIEKPIDHKNFYKQILQHYKNKKHPLDFDEKEKYLDKYTDKLIESLKDKINKLEASNTMLKKVDKLKSDFISVASHELKTPIVPIIGYLDILLSEKHGKLNPKQKEIINKINDSSFRLSDIIDKIIDMARLEKGFTKLNIKEFDIINLTKKVISDLAPIIEKRNIHSEFIHEKDSLLVKADPDKIEFVIYNIINNAIKFSKDNEKITVKIVENNNYIEIFIIDYGIGLVENELYQVFEKFFSGTDVTYHHSSNYEFKGRGIGLGLAICKDFINMHNGKINVTSAGKNKGSKFFFSLPKN
jgi:signal transduction histidine kinase